MTDEQIKHMAERFLTWKLPVDFSPDNGISCQRPNYGPNVAWEPVGTNLFSYTQAEAMVRHMLAGLPRPERADAGLAKRLSDEADLCRNDGANDIAELLDEAKAALRAQPSVDAIDAEGVELDWWNPDPGDPYWMLEVRQGFDNAGAWLKNRHSYLTTREASRALRYPSRQAADYARRQLGGTMDGRFEPTEHIDMPARTPSPEKAEIERLRHIVKWAADDFETLSKVYGVLTDSDRSHFSKCSAKFRAALASTDQGEG